MRKLHLPLIASVLLSMGALAEVRVWKDSAGEREIEAEFVSLKGDELTLKLKKGNIVKLPLDKISEADQKFALEAAEKLLVKIEATAYPVERTKMSTSGKATNVTNLMIQVDLSRDDIADAHVLRDVKLEPVAVNGRLLKHVPYTLGRGFYDTLAKTRSGTHPRGGIRLELEFGRLPKDSKTVEALHGVVILHIGEEYGSVDLGGLSRMGGTVSHDALRSAGLNLSMKHAYFEGDLRLAATVKKSDLAFAGLELIGEDGRPCGLFFTRTIHGTSVSYGTQISPGLIAKTGMRVHYRERGEDLEIPFVIRDLEIIE